jgi:DNA-binding IclR family transcriptional regulator
LTPVTPAVRRVKSGGGPPSRSPLQRAFLALDLLSAEPKTAADIARSLRINRSSALRLLRELEGTGYVARSLITKRYSLVSARFQHAAARSTDHSDLSEIVDPILRSVRDESDESAVFAVPSADAMVYLGFFPSHHVLAVHESLGAIRPMHCSALGKAYLSALADRKFDETLGRLSYDGGTSNAAKNPDELAFRVDAARRCGYAIDRDETSVGVSCVAAPLWVGGSLVGAVGITGPSSRLPDHALADIGRELVEAVRSVQLSGPAVRSDVRQRANAR